MESEEKFLEVLEGLKSIENVIGVAILSKFKEFKYYSLPEWIVPKTFITVVGTVLESMNEALKALKQGELFKIEIESSQGNMLICVAGNHFIVILTKKGISLKLPDLHEHIKSLEFKN